MDDSSDDGEETCSSETTSDSDEHVVNEAGLLETITEEDQDRVTTGSSVHSSEGLHLIIILSGVLVSICLLFAGQR